MLLKFIQLPVGQAFVFEGQTYVKSSPLMARSDSSGQERFMPRSAVVQTGGEPPPVSAPLRDLAAADVMRAWSVFKARMEEAARGVEQRGETECAAELRRFMEAAMKEFERELEPGGTE